jgi:microbial collagenase
VPEFTQFTADLANNLELENAYQNFIDQKIQEIDNLSNPQSLFVDYNSLSTNNIQDIQARFNQTRLGYRGNCLVSTFEMFSRFTCKGSLTGTRRSNQNKTQAWIEFNQDLNHIISESQRLGLNNFDSMLCRVSNINFVDLQNGYFYPMADYNCHGPLGPLVDNNLDPLQKITTDFQQTSVGHLTRCFDQTSNQIQCNIYLSSPIYPSYQDNVTLLDSIDTLLTSSANSVYASNPSFYADFFCDLNLESQRIVDLPSNQKYMIQNATCSLLH